MIGEVLKLLKHPLQLAAVGLIGGGTYLAQRVWQMVPVLSATELAAASVVGTGIVLVLSGWWGDRRRRAALRDEVRRLAARVVRDVEPVDPTAASNVRRRVALAEQKGAEADWQSVADHIANVCEQVEQRTGEPLRTVAEP